MSTNKHAIIRYQALDKCFSNFGREFFMQDLIDACDKALFDYTGVLDGVKRRTVFDDIKFMESEAGFSIDLVRVKHGHKVSYRYNDCHFSINKSPISDAEFVQIRNTVLMLKRFSGLPNFEWIEDVSRHLEACLYMSNKEENVVGFDSNPYLIGFNYFSILFNAIINKLVLKIVYKPYYKKNLIYEIHPYYLKEYNKRWFLFGCTEYAGNKSLACFPLDRICDIEELTCKNYLPNDEIDFEDYFSDIVGVSKDKKQQPEKVILRVEGKTIPYLLTKPLHGSQKKPKNLENGMFDLELNLIINYEFEALILSYGESIEVISPIELREKLKHRISSLLKKYEQCR